MRKKRKTEEKLGHYYVAMKRDGDFGSRDLTPSDSAISQIWEPWMGKNPDRVICGMARGADMAGHAWAKKRGIPIEEMPADWETYGKAAGKVRNREMAKIATCAIGFWDRSSPGTANMCAWLAVFDVALKLVCPTLR